jgi:transposase
VLYDVTSAYFEGLNNELGFWGYDRDNKKGKKQIVIGLLTGPDGEPLSVKVFDGNTSDPETIMQQLQTLKERFGIEQIVFVGDRGMVKTKGKVAIHGAGFKYITAITDPTIRAFLKKSVFQISLFDETIHEVEHNKLRYILRRNPDTRRKEDRRRQDKLLKLKEKVRKRNELVSRSKRAKPEAGLKALKKWVETHKLHTFVTLTLELLEIKIAIDDEMMANDALLDGCYVIETDVPKQGMDAQAVHDRYLDLQMVERDFRTMKTTLLEVRPIFLRKANRTRAHVFIVLLALKIVREMRRCLTAVFGTTDDDKMAVTLDDALTALSRLCLHHYDLKEVEIVRIPLPDDNQERILKALNINMPTVISSKAVGSM